MEQSIFYCKFIQAKSGYSEFTRLVVQRIKGIKIDVLAALEIADSFDEGHQQTVLHILLIQSRICISFRRKQ